MEIVNLIILLAFEVCLCIMGFNDKKSKRKYIIIFIFTWIILAFTMDSYDISNYRNTYENGIIRRKEASFDNLSIFFASHGVPFNTYKFLWGTVICLFLYKGLKKYTTQIAAIAAIFSIVPLWGFATQMRSSMAGAIIIFALPYLFEKNKINYIKYVILVIIATVFHSMGIFYLVLLPATIFDFDSKRYKIITIIVSFFLVVLFWANTDLIQSIFTRLYLTSHNEAIRKLMGRFLSYFGQNYRSNIKGLIYFTTHHYLVYILTESLLKRVEKNNIYIHVGHKDFKVSLLRNINATMLLIIPFYTISGQYVRFFYYFLPVCYACVLENDIGNSKISIRVGSRIMSLQELLMIACAIFVFIMGIKNDPGEILRMAGGLGLPW